jgi:GT2 family glycosyltransferase
MQPGAIARWEGVEYSPLSHASHSPSVSVVVATRNRHAHLAACLATILDNPGQFEIIVVDQSDDAAAEEIATQIHDPRVRFVRSPTRGVTSARNLGIELSAAEIVAFTDDDCRVAPDWVAALTAVFATDADAAVVCGRVRVPPEIQSLGFTENFEPQVREWQGRFPPFGTWGITANLALRREVVARVGPFDPLLGAGSPLRSGGEPDFLYRVLRAGLKLVYAREVLVDHLGVRGHGQESRKLIRGYGFGTGAAFFKHVRLGDSVAARVYASFLIASLQRVCGNLIRTKRPVGLGYSLAFVWGTISSCRFGVDRQSRMYVSR